MVIIHSVVITIIMLLLPSGIIDLGLDMTGMTVMGMTFFTSTIDGATSAMQPSACLSGIQLSLRWIHAAL